MKHKDTYPWRQLAFCILWLAFLWLQVILFSPVSQPSNSFALDFNAAKPEVPISISSLDVPTKIDSNPRQLSKKREQGDALFNNIDVYYTDFLEPTSDVRCIGRDLLNPELNTNYSWMFRSCEFRKLCLDTESKEFILLDDSMSGSSHEDQPLALGAINPRWSGRGKIKGFHKVKWFPRRVSKDTIQGGYYELPDDVVMVPFHSMAAHNVGHLLWDDFYPIFTLLSLFGYNPDPIMGKSYQYLMLRWFPEKKLYATCEIRPNKGQLCDANFQRFLPLMGVNLNTFSTVKEVELTPSSQPLKSKYVCSKQAVAGLGMLMDHGMRDHGKFKLVLFI